MAFAANTQCGTTDYWNVRANAVAGVFTQWYVWRDSSVSPSPCLLLCSYNLTINTGLVLESSVSGPQSRTEFQNHQMQCKDPQESPCCSLEMLQTFLILNLELPFLWKLLKGRLAQLHKALENTDLTVTAFRVSSQVQQNLENSLEFSSWANT